ncbi:TIMELESS-interacting protein isoform X2 [Patagioenas fasciata]|uniref:TIMELESS-interacting protein isoform X2 n=1 Tax=Patagioenas fasciata TaxID=372321 RepID=UPI003A995882
MMDPLENNLFDLPDYENTEDETFPPLPPPASPGRDDAEWAQANGEPDGNQQSQTKDSAVATRRAVKRPMPKLDAQRLISERGLPALRHMFDNVKFKGKGHEAEDLKTLIRHMEHWAHRLFPKLQFEDFVDRVESLGSKKEVQMVEGKATGWIQPLKMHIPALKTWKNSLLCLAQPSRRSNSSECKRTGSWPWSAGRRRCSAAASHSTPSSPLVTQKRSLLLQLLRILLTLLKTLKLPQPK